MSRHFQREFFALRPLLAALLFIFLLSVNASALARGLRGDVERLLQDNGLTGAVWSTVTSDGSIAVDSAGVKDARTGEPRTRQAAPPARSHCGSG
jgi:hypothetical protein